VGPAAYVRPAGFLGTLGFIDAMEHKFCDTCNRVRLTAEGFLKLCLYSNAGLDTRALLRGGVGGGAGAGPAGACRVEEACRTLF
jgi:molybdenum cofactor biosynthesis protein A